MLWKIAFPAELAGCSDLRFQTGLAAFATNAEATQNSIYAVTNDGRLAQIWDTNTWNLDFPAELAGCSNLRFQPGVAVFATNAAANKKSIYAVTSDGRLVQIWDTNTWNLDFPAELAGYSNLRFQPGVAVFATNAAANKKSIYAVTTDGELAQIWDTNTWNLDFPAEQAVSALRFQPGVAVFATNAAANKKSIYAVTTDGKLAQIWDTNQWNLDFPADQVGYSGLVFTAQPAVVVRDAAANKKSIFVTTDNRLVELWDTTGWNLDVLFEGTANSGVRIQHSPTALANDVTKNLNSIYCVDTTGRLAQVWNVYSVAVPFAMQDQLQSNWCWAATASSIALFYDVANPWPQCRVVNAVLGTTTCCTSPLPAGCNVPGQMYDALSEVGHLAQLQSGPIGVETIMDELNAGRPIVAQIEWQGGGGHATVIVGCNEDGLLSIEDSDSLVGYSHINIEDFSVRYMGSGKWTQTFFTK